MNNTDKYSDRYNRVARIFDKEQVESEDTTEVGDNAETIIKQLNHLMQKELHTWWDYTTLNSYLEKKMIPCGLRIKKWQPPFSQMIFQQEWDNILTSCSTDLIK